MREVNRMSLTSLIVVGESGCLSRFDSGDPTQQIAGFTRWLGRENHLLGIGALTFNHLNRQSLGAEVGQAQFDVMLDAVEHARDGGLALAAFDTHILQLSNCDAALTAYRCDFHKIATDEVAM